ncbi:MAG: GNAT family N-acetyltransferase [Betaproteobacteria bacterium]
MSRHPVPTTAAAITIRLARAMDAPALAALAERTFRATFDPHNSDANMRLYCGRAYDAAIQAAEIADPRRVTIVADDGGALVGYAQLRQGDAPACVVADRPAEIQRIYVDARWHGRGVAQALMDAALGHARERRADRVWLGVWEHNARARRFYGKSGFAEVGDHAFVLGDEVQRDLVMVRELGAAVDSTAS